MMRERESTVLSNQQQVSDSHEANGFGWKMFSWELFSSSPLWPAVENLDNV